MKKKTKYSGSVFIKERNCKIFNRDVKPNIQT